MHPYAINPYRFHNKNNSAYSVVFQHIHKIEEMSKAGLQNMIPKIIILLKLNYYMRLRDKT